MRPAIVTAFLTQDLPRWQHFALALILAVVLAPAILSLGTLAGTDPALPYPQGDQAQAQAGAYYYYRDSWRLPLFAMAVPGVDGLRSVIFTDSIPLLALFGKIWFKLTGTAAGLTTPWLWICLLGQAFATVLLMDQIGLRRLAQIISGVVVALVMPAWLFRYWMWHLALCGQFLLILALALSLRPAEALARSPLDWKWPALLVAALWIHPYFLAMTLPFFLLGAARSANVRLPGALGRTLLAAAIALTAAGAAMGIGGYLGGGLLRASGGFDTYSMNLLAPFGAMGKSGLLRGGGHFARGTEGQMEGFNYLGLGLLTGLAMVFAASLRDGGNLLRAAVRRQWPLLVLLGGLSIYALSGKVYIGAHQVLSYRWPAVLDGVTGTFRASGRFFWPVGYAIGAFVLYGISRQYRAGTAAALVLAVALLQWLDTSQLRHVALAEKSADPVSSDPDIGRLVAAHTAVSIQPPIGCTDDPASLGGGFAVQLLAARNGKAINSLSGARQYIDCDGQALALRRLKPGSGTLVVLGPPYDAAYVDKRRWLDRCLARHQLHFCSLHSE